MLVRISILAPWSLAASLLVAASGCTTMGKAAVNVETGNQPTGYLTRPMGLTAASDESVGEVAQDICDNVKRGSTAKITFVEKVPGPGPFDLADWGRYRYDCESGGTVAPAPAHRTVAAGAVAPATAVAPAPAGEPAATGSRETPQKRACVLQQGVYHVCLGQCMLDSSSPPETVTAECEQRCTPQNPMNCK